MLPEHLHKDPLIARLAAKQPVFWRNPNTAPFAQAQHDIGLNAADVAAAEACLQRFAPYLAEAFPDTAEGIIESPLYRLAAMETAFSVQGRLYLKADSELPVSGSIKARGGIYEVLQHAEQLALAAGLLRSQNDDYRLFGSEAAKKLFARHTVAVGSTGNLGLSIGIMAAKLGFRACVHMSADAKQWKKDTLRACGAEVYEYSGDYGEAVAAGRLAAQSDPLCHFVDDENSPQLFLGYATAGLRLKQQLAEAGEAVCSTRPLYVYLPCGVGGGPGGVAFGLKLAFGDHVRCIFVEPTASPCMLLGVYSGLHDGICVADIGLDNLTAADGLAVGRASGFVGRAMQRSLDAFATVGDEELFRLQSQLWTRQQRKLEPSACAGFAALPPFADRADALHIVWATGGSMVPEAVFLADLQRGQAVCTPA